MNDLKLSIKEQKQLKSHMGYMYQDLRKWGIKTCQVINLQPQPPKDSEDNDKWVGYHVIQGTHKSTSGKVFNFQILREHNLVKDNGSPQYKLILQYGKDDCIESLPQTNPDLKALILNYIYNPVPMKMVLYKKPTKSKTTK